LRVGAWKASLSDLDDLFLTGLESMGFRSFNGSDEAVAEPRDGFDIARILRGVAQGGPQFLYRRVEAVLEVNEGVRLSQTGAHLFPGYDFPGAFQQHGQELKRLAAQLYTNAMFAQLTRLKIDFENPEAVLTHTGQRAGNLVGELYHHLMRVVPECRNYSPRQLTLFSSGRLPVTNR
jgi:hypothetical protein